MKSYNFDVALRGLDGKFVENSNIGKTFANFVAGSESTPRSQKWIEWARALFTTGQLVCDDSDVSEIREWVRNNKVMNQLLSAEILGILDRGVEVEVKKKDESAAA